MPLEAIGQTREPAPVRTIPFLAIAILSLLVLAAHASQYLPFLSDDTLISLRYADRLIDGQGLTWTPGERVEGYSNLLWVLACAALGALGLDLITASRVLGFLGMGGAILAGIAMFRPRAGESTLPALAAGLSMACTGSFAVWAIGGLEQPLLLSLIAWSCLTCRGLAEASDPRPRDALLPGVLLGLACWTRPDSPLFVAVFTGLLLWWRPRSRSHRRAAAMVAATAFAFYGAQLMFRLLYYGAWVPNSTHGKLAFSAARVATGLDYLVSGVWMLLPLVVPALLAVVVTLGDSRASRRLAWFWVPAVVWSVYVVVIGGDIFPGRRHLGVLVLFASLLSAGFFARLRVGPPAVAALAASLGLLAFAQWKLDPENDRARSETWEWDGEVVGTLLHRAFADREPLLAVTSAGTLPYFSRLPSLDMLGLNDRYIATHPPEDLGEGPLGHELGDGAYVLSREPDLVVFCAPDGGPVPCFRSGIEMAARPEFHRRYRLVPFLGEAPYVFRSEIWVRVDSPRVGLRREPGRFEIPGYLLASQGRAVAALDRAGRIGMRTAGGGSALSATLSLAPGRWRYAVESTGDLAVRVDRGSGTPAVGTAGEFTLDAAADVSVSISGAGHVRRVILERA